MVAIVTGSSSGIGYEVCRQLLEKGYKVYGISRRGRAPEGVTTLCADVSDETAVRSAIDEIACQEGRIDLLIANAGPTFLPFVSIHSLRKLYFANLLANLQKKLGYRKIFPYYFLAI